MISLKIDVPKIIAIIASTKIISKNNSDTLSYLNEEKKDQKGSKFNTK